ncbi:unnamed protein product [Bursaphelenchus okinawaensis]|uniref:Uncharacterized protein n=1 Tax=Bursaphelenchus okinawaensis TaxID=465554 RepID=A0A811JVV4_9BILA|nr:unnamed protein product [Bursaphelenchus okinawaensis]CAG9084783.1 unnamed protein product [Bursaphelenchus okinawaensis]
MRAVERLLLPTVLFILFLVFTVDAVNRGHQVNAEEVKKVICPQCYKMESGMIQEFFVVSNVYYGLRYIPVFNLTRFQRYMIEVTGGGFFKRVQVKLMDGDYQYAVNGRNNMRSTDPQFCFHNTQYPMDHERAFTYLYIYIKSKTEAYDLRRVCDDDFQVHDPAFLLQELPRELAGEFNYQYLDTCFEFKNRTCVYDVDNPSYLTFFEGKRHRIAYMRNGIVVYLGCIDYRCAYYMHDTKTGTDWWIPDDIKVHTSSVSGDIRTIVPLLRPDDPFNDSPLRYKYTTTTETPTTQLTTTVKTTRQTLAPLTRNPGGDDTAPEHHEEPEAPEHHEDGSETETVTKADSSAENVAVMWIVALMLYGF